MKSSCFVNRLIREISCRLSSHQIQILSWAPGSFNSPYVFRTCFVVCLTRSCSSELVTYPQLTFSLSLLDLNSLKGNKMLMCVSKELWDLGLYYQVLKKASGDPVLSRLTMLSCHPAWSARYHPLSSSSLCLGINQPSETSQYPRAADSEIIAGPNILKVQEEGHAHLLWTVVLFQGRHFERELIKMKGERERQQPYSLTLR